MFLSRADVERITKRTKFGAQRRALDRLRITYTTAADGEPLVRPEALDRKPKLVRNREPRWDLIGVKREAKTA